MIPLLLATLAADPVVAAAGEAVPCNRLVCGVNESIHSHHTDTPEAVGRAYRLLRPAMLRYPGGTVASLWDFQSDRYLPVDVWEPRLGRRPIWVDWCQWQAKGMRAAAEKAGGEWSATDPVAFGRFAESIGAEVSWTLNLATDAADDPAAHPSLQLLRRLKAAGVPVRFVELGNELEGDSFADRWPAVEDFLAEVDPLVAVIRGEFPDAKLAIPSHVVMADAMESDANNPAGGGGRHLHWASVTRDREDGLALVNHTYLGGRGLKDAVGLKAYVAAVRAEKADPLLGVDFVLQSPHFMAEAAAAWVAYTDKKIWQTEFNLWLLDEDPFAVYRDTPAEGLYLAAWLVEMLKRPDVFELAHWHSLLGPQFGLAELDGDDVRLSPAGEMFAFLSRLANEADRVRPVTLKDGPTVAGRLVWEGQASPAVSGIVFEKDGGEPRLVLLNLSREKVTVDVTGIGFANPRTMFLPPVGPLETQHRLHRPYAGDRGPFDPPENPKAFGGTLTGVDPFDFMTRVEEKHKGSARWGGGDALALPPYSLSVSTPW